MDKVLLAGSLALGTGLGKVCLEGRGLGDKIEPDEGGDLGNLQDFGLEGGVRDLGRGGVDFVRVVRAQVDLRMEFRFWEGGLKNGGGQTSCPV